MNLFKKYFTNHKKSRDKKIHILIFNWRDLKHTWTGGGEIYVFEQAKRWVKIGHSVTVFCGQDHERKLPEFEIIDGIKIHRRGGRYSLYFWAVVNYFTKLKEEIDIVIDVENGIPFFTPLFCRKPKMCYVYHVHGKQFFYEIPKPLSYIGYFIERYLFSYLYKNTRIVAISKTTKKQLIDIGFNKKNIHVVYSGINSTYKQNSFGKYTNPTLLYLGRIKAYKRVDLLIKIFPEILKKIPRARLVIAGWGTEASYITDLIMQSPLRRKISLLGPVSAQEKHLLLSKAWIFLNPSIGEGWGLAVIEANLHGTPAIAFNVSGLAESIQDARTGYLAKDEQDFKDKICHLLLNRKQCERLSMNARKWAQQFDWDKTANKNLHLLQSLLQ
jgi:glycosyltransferase involved in cell wall biosynthesis